MAKWCEWLAPTACNLATLERLCFTVKGGNTIVPFTSPRGRLESTSEFKSARRSRTSRQRERERVNEESGKEIVSKRIDSRSGVTGLSEKYISARSGRVEIVRNARRQKRGQTLRNAHIPSCYRHAAEKARRRGNPVTSRFIVGGCS